MEYVPLPVKVLRVTHAEVPAGATSMDELATPLSESEAVAANCCGVPSRAPLRGPSSVVAGPPVSIVTVRLGVEATRPAASVAVARNS